MPSNTLNTPKNPTLSDERQDSFNRRGTEKGIAIDLERNGKSIDLDQKLGRKSELGIAGGLLSKLGSSAYVVPGTLMPSINYVFNYRETNALSVA